MPQHRILLDCDPGRDDALAIAMALASPAEIQLVGITAVAGNVPLALTYRNARFICGLCGFAGMPVYAGADGPLARQAVTGTRAHGESGLEGMEVDMQPVAVEPDGALSFMAETLRAAGEDEITLVAIGPLTNVAKLVAEAPELLSKIRQIVLMGGASRAGGNVTPAAEFNVFADPHAAARVFDCGRPMTVVSLDATHQVLATPDRSDRLARAGRGPAGRLAALLRPAAGVALPVSAQTVCPSTIRVPLPGCCSRNCSGRSRFRSPWKPRGHTPKAPRLWIGGVSLADHRTRIG